jgi:4-hydroxy-3-polyprenylbenzoate decarboxylase
VKLVVAATGASGAIYLQRLLDHLPREGHEIHLLLSTHARQVIAEEIDALRVPDDVIEHADGPGMNVPFVSGSARFDAMVIVPCSMGTVGRIASGASESTLLRAADVFLKERRKLILVPRETPWSLIHARNVVAVTEAGAIVMPACPSFYSRPDSVEAVADTLIFRILDHLGLPQPGAFRWKS